MKKTTKKNTNPLPETACTCCGREARATPENEGYSDCCNDRISYDPREIRRVREENGR